MCLSAGLGVVLTIGELPYQRRFGLALFTLRKQLVEAMKGIQADDWNRIVIAYEPVWAVGEGATPCSKEEAQRINAYLKRLITRRVNESAAAACRLNDSNNLINCVSTSSDVASTFSGVSATRPPQESRNVPEHALRHETIISCSSRTFATSDEPKY